MQPLLRGMITALAEYLHKLLTSLEGSLLDFTGVCWTLQKFVMGGTGSANPVSMPHLLVKAGSSASAVSIPQKLMQAGRTSAIANTIPQ